MKLLIISNLFEPDQGGGAALFSDMCFGLVDRGHEVTVLTTHPYYPEWRRKNSESAWRVKHEVLRGVEVYRYGLFVPKYPSRLVSRILYEGSFAISLLRSLRRLPRYDAVMVYCPLLSAVAFAALRKWIIGDPLWLNVQDIPADAAIVSGISRSRVFNGLAPRVQRWLFRRADAWSSICPAMVERLQALRLPGQPVHLCGNWLHHSLAECIRQQPSKIGRLPQHPVRLLYAGNIGKKQGLLEFCRVLKSQSADFQFRIIGNGSEAETLSQFVAAAHDPRFQFERFRDEQQFAAALHQTDLFLITEKPEVGASFFPSKLIPCITSGTPMIAICEPTGPLGQEIQQHQLGWIVSWEAVEQVQQLVAPSAIADAFPRVQHNCLVRAKSYEREFGISRYETLLADLAASPSRTRQTARVPSSAGIFSPAIPESPS